MARQKAPCGTYSAYRRHRREGSEPCAACVRAKNKHNASRSVSASARERSEPVVRAQESVPVEVNSFDRHAELLRTLELVDTAIDAAIDDDPVKLAPLIRERRELIAELGPVEVVEEVDPFDEFLAGEGNVVRFDSAKGREAS